MVGDVGLVFFLLLLGLLRSTVSIARIDIIVSQIKITAELQDSN